MGLPDFSLPSCPPPKPLSCQTRSGENCLGGVLYPGLCGSCRLRFVPSAHITIQSPAHSPLLPWRCFIHGRPAPPRPQDGSKELSRLSAHSWLFLPGIQLCPPLLLLLYKSIVFVLFWSFLLSPWGTPFSSWPESEISCAWCFATCFFQSTAWRGSLASWTQTGLPHSFRVLNTVFFFF